MHTSEQNYIVFKIIICIELFIQQMQLNALYNKELHVSIISQ